jgi:PPOX class probable F420-dependent enzyme
MPGRCQAVPVHLDPAGLPASALEFLRERHLATLTTLRPDGSPHVVPVGFTWDDDAGLARVITGGGSRKARNLDRGGRAAVCQVDGWRWLSLEGPARVVRDPQAVADAERRYAERYRVPRENPTRVVLEIAVERALGLLSRPVPRS